MRIGIDFDDTLADFSGLLARQARERWDVDLPALRAAGRTLTETVGQERTDALIIEILETDLTLEMGANPDAIEVAQRLGATHELVVVTARGDHEADAPRRWLQRHGVPVADFIATNRGPKATPCEDHGLSVLLDDTVTTFDLFAEHRTVSALYLGGRAAAECAAHVRTVEHWLRFEALVDDLARPEGDVPAHAIARSAVE